MLCNYNKLKGVNARLIVCLSMLKNVRKKNFVAGSLFQGGSPAIGKPTFFLTSTEADVKILKIRTATV